MVISPSLLRLRLQPYYKIQEFSSHKTVSLTQMSRRCSISTYHSLGLLSGFKWLIGPRGYANMTKTPADSRDGRDEVYGILYELEVESEEALDIAEGVPYAYEKMALTVASTKAGRRSDVQALVCIDMVRMGEGVCREEYVARMNRGIRGAVEKGIPESYVRLALRKWVRDEEVPPDVVVDHFAPVEK